MNDNNRYREEEKEEKENNPHLDENLEQSPDEHLDEVKQETIFSNESNEHLKDKKKKKNHLYEKYVALQKENNELKDLLLRNQAELENFKKRMNEERMRDRKYALTDILTELIDVVDIFDKAVNVKTDDEKLQKFLSGFAMVNNTYKQILKRNGVEAIDALGKPFDPAVHAAVEMVKVDGVDSNTVVEVIITGYTYKDRVLRPSMVKVSE